MSLSAFNRMRRLKARLASEAENQEQVDLEDLTVEELKEQAKERGIDLKSGMKKAEIIEALTKEGE